jgi:hypothetical protein
LEDREIQAGKEIRIRYVAFFWVVPSLAMCLGHPE